MRKITLALALPGLLFICCEPVQDRLGPPATLENIKSITTRFISHQGDTQHKDARVVAVAQFNVDGTLQEVVQHMTYPYNFKEPYDRYLWMQPDTRNLGHIMDGLDFGIADNNFLYGNDWPVKYAKIDPNNYPRFRGKGVEGGLESRVTYAFGEWPEEIRTSEQFKSFVDEEEIDGMTFLEAFTNDGKFITGYSDSMIPSARMKKAMEEAMQKHFEKTGKKDEFAEARARAYDLPKEPNVRFFYTNDLLERTEFQNKAYRFYYDEIGQLARSEFYLNDRMYNSRHYFYDENGLKTKTEIFNVDGEPEYTIQYEYEFFEAG